MNNLTRRGFIKSSLAAGTLAVLPTSNVLGANDRINLGVVGLGGRGSGHCGWFGRIGGVQIAALAEPDKSRLNRAKKKNKGAKAYTDVREMLDDKDIDAVAIATCNHWHCLAAIWACQAGKDVYVEKPLGHNNFEQEQLIAAARKYNRIVQVGNQQRSDPLQKKIKDFLDTGKLGQMKWVHANRYGRRGSIGKREKPMDFPENIVKDLWLGPAADEPVYRKNLQYDWHWDWNTGNGEMGNWGPHIIDDVRNTALRDKGGLPQRIIAGGGRVVWKDAGETPNVHFIYYDTRIVPVVFGLSNIPVKPGVRRSPQYKGTRSGYVIECENGWYAGGRGGGAAFDTNGKKIKGLGGNAGGGHAANFIEAVRKQDRSILNCEVEVGACSTAWCNLGNIAYRLGGEYSRDEAMEINKGYKPWADLLDEMKEMLDAHGIDIESSQIKLSPILEMDNKTQRFTGPNAKEANKLIKREYRKKEYTVPEKV